MNTDALVLRDAIYERVLTLTGPTWARTMKVPVPTIHPQHLPTLGVFMAEEEMSRDGDGGAPAFVHQATIIVSMIDKGGDADVIEDRLDDWIARAKAALLTDSTFIALSEQVASIRTMRTMPRDGEAHFAEMRMAITLTFRSFWEPVVPDNFETLRIDSRYPSPNTDPDVVQQVGAAWDIPQQ